MQEKDFLECEFNGDNTKYFAEVTHVDNTSKSFDCRFLDSGDAYTFDSDSMKVTSMFGAISAGSRVADYTLFTADSSQNFNAGGYVAVTFTDGNRFLGELTDID